MLHARVIRPPLLRAVLRDIPEDARVSLAPSVQVVRDGNFLAVLSEREEAAAAAADALSQRVIWEPAEELPDQSGLAAWLRAQPARRRCWRTSRKTGANATRR